MAFFLLLIIRRNLTRYDTILRVINSDIFKKTNENESIKQGGFQMAFKYSYSDKRYHTLNYHLREKYNQKIFKVMINAGFTCPNIDGTITYGGCTFCSTKGSGDFAGSPEDDLKTQFNTVSTMMHQKWPEAGYIASGHF